MQIIRILAVLLFTLTLNAQTEQWQQLDTTQVRIEMKYATADNFLGKAVYPCASCWLLQPTAEAVLKAQAYFVERGYTLLIWDCYRPRSIQYKMWELVKNPAYVANPKKGSIHNRGGAIDLTLATLDGQILDMGTAFDHFGPEAHRQYAHLTAEQQANRALLEQGMEAAGFIGLPSEWWHYDLKGSAAFPLQDFQWECP